MYLSTTLERSITYTSSPDRLRRPQLTSLASALVPADSPSRRCSPGDSGTGKTMAAEVRRRRRSGSTSTRSTSPTVVNKYIGETEKNLDADLRRGRAASTACCSSTRPTRCSASAPRCSDAHDRYANIEVAYLLQRHGGVRRHRDPRHQPARATSTRPSCAGSTSSSTSRCPTRSTAASSGSGCLPPDAAAWPTTSTSTSCAQRVRAHRRQHPQHRSSAAAYLAAADNRRRRHARPDPRHRARVPQARPADCL